MRILLAAMLCFALGIACQASSHTFSAKIVMSAIAEKQHYSPGDKFSVETKEGSALVEYKGVVEMPGSDEYAVVISVKRW